MKLQLTKGCLLLSGLLWFNYIQAQTPRFQKLSSENGLSQDNTTSIIRDERGFLWVGTNYGLNRYNGNSFELFTTNSKPFNIINNAVRWLSFDTDNNLIIGTISGLTVFEKKSNKSVHIKLHKGNNRWNAEVISVYTISPRLWLIGTTENIIIYDYSRKKIIKQFSRFDFNITYNKVFDNVWHFYKKGTAYYAVFGNAVYSFDTKTLNFTPYWIFGNKDMITTGMVYENTTGNIWVIGRRMLLKLNVNEKKVENFTSFIIKPNPKNTLNINSILLVKNKVLLGVQEGGICFFDPQTKACEYVPELLPSKFAGTNRIAFGMLDKTGTIWFTTDNGIVYSTPWSQKISHINLNSSATPINETEIRALAEDPQKNIWIGTTDALLEYDTKSGNIKNHHLQDKDGMVIKNINVIYIVAKNEMMLGSQYGLYWYKNGKVIKIKPLITNGPEERIINRIWDIQMDKGLYRISSLNNMVMILNPVNNETQIYKSDEDMAFFNSVIFGNYVFAGGNSAMFRWNLKGGKPEKYNICYSQICHVVLQNKALWIATQNDGVIKMDKEGKVLNSYLNDGTYIIYHLWFSPTGELYCATNKGLVILNNGKIKYKFNSSFGLAENTFNFGNIFLPTDWGFLFATNHKLHLMPLNLNEKLSYYKPVIDKFKTGDSIYFHPLKCFSLPKLSASTHYISIFTANPEWPVGKSNSEYQIRMDQNGAPIYTNGDEWKTFNTQRGNHKLILSSLDNSKTFQTLNWHIESFYYQTWWFKTLIGISSLLFVVLTLRLLLRNKYISRQLYSTEMAVIKAEREKNKIELQALRSQMDPHLIFNTLSGIQTLIMQKDETRAIKFLHEFSTLLRSVLEVSKLNFIHLETEIEFLHGYLELHKLRYKDFDFEINQINLRAYQKYFIPSMCIQPLAENCFVHAFRGNQKSPRIKIELEKTGETVLQVKVMDNGSGLGNKISQGSGHSLGHNSLRKRLMGWASTYKIKTDLQIESQNDGTTIIFEIPLTPQSEQ